MSRSRTGWPNTLAEIDALPGRRSGACSQGTGRVPRRPGEPLRPRRRQAGRRPRRDEGGDAGAGLGQGAGLRPLRRDDRRDRRVRPARPLRLGGGIPGPGDGRLRPHAGPGTGVAQPHGQHRHRLRLRRQAHRPALPGEGVRLGPRRPHLLRTGPALPARRTAGTRAHGPAGPRRGSRRRRRAGQADRPDPAAGQRHDSGGERHGGAGGDEPVRRQPEVADLPAAHDVALRDEQASRACWSIPPRRSPTTATRVSRRSSAKRSTWARGRSWSSAGTSKRPRERFGVTEGRDRHRLHPHGPAVLQRPGPGAAVPRPGAGGPDRCRPLERSWRRRGSASTAN